MQYRGYDIDAFKLMAICAVRSLLSQRHCPSNGKDARYYARRWLSDLRNIRDAHA